MTIFYIRTNLAIILLLVGRALFGQENFTGYLEPDIALSYDVATNYSHNFSLSQRSYIYDDDFELRVRQLDIAHFSKLNIAYGQSIALGVQYRFRQIFDGGDNELRLTQQYNVTHKSGNLRIGNRLRAEQRIRPSLTIHRFRYRLAFDLPLSGEELDVGEAYFVASTESLLSASRGSGPEFDQRVSANIGWLVNQTINLEIGTQYRVENYTQRTENVLFLLTSLAVNL